MNNFMKQRGRWVYPTLAGTISVAGIVGLYNLATLPPTKPSSTKYENIPGISLNNQRLVRYDNDEDVDLITSDDMGHVYWVAPDMVDIIKKEGKKRYSLDLMTTTPRMTPEIQEAATRTSQAQRDLAYLIDTEKFRLWEEEQKNKK